MEQQHRRRRIEKEVRGGRKNTDGRKEGEKVIDNVKEEKKNKTQRKEGMLA